MPRKRQTLSGADAQSIESVEGQRYGEGVEQQQMQQAMPAPNLSVAPTTTGGPMVEAPMPTADPAAIQQFLQSHKPELLSQGTQLPDQHVMSGLSTGPGAGPEALAMSPEKTPLARTLRQLSQDTGNPLFARLAQRVGL